MSDIDLPVKNLFSQNLISLKDNNHFYKRNLLWGVRSNKLSLIWFLISELLPIIFLWFSSMSCFFKWDFSFLWSLKFSDTLLSFLDISVFCLDFRYIAKTYEFIYIFTYFVSLNVNFIFFLHIGQLWSLVDNDVKIIFQLSFRIISIREQK